MYFLIRLLTLLGNTLRLWSRVFCFGGALRMSFVPDTVAARARGLTPGGAQTGKSCAGGGWLGTKLVPSVPSSRRVIGPEVPMLLFLKVSLSAFSGSSTTAMWPL